VSEEERAVIESICSPQNGENEEINRVPHKERNRVPPRWRNNYVTGEGLSEESEEEANINLHFLALFTSNPVHFKEAVKHDKWRTTMDIEIQAIERNNT
jgi:membrane carboxypeptidase/penicillin-binding protein PbpC